MGILGRSPMGVGRSDGGDPVTLPTPMVSTPFPLPLTPGRFGGARAARGNRASGAGVSGFPLKCTLEATAKGIHQTTDASYGKPFLNCPGWLPAAQDSCQDALPKMESHFHALRAARKAPESGRFPTHHPYHPGFQIQQMLLSSGRCNLAQP